MLFAHSGRTDSKGGHYDTKTGEYHFHHHSNNNFLLIIFLFLGFSSLVFLYLISRNTKENNIKQRNSYVKYELSEQDKELEKWKKKRDRENDRRSIFGCLVYIFAFIVTMISIFAIPDGNGFFVVFIFILFICFYNPHRKK